MKLRIFLAALAITAASRASAYDYTLHLTLDQMRVLNKAIGKLTIEEAFPTYAEIQNQISAIETKAAADAKTAKDKERADLEADVRNKIAAEKAPAPTPTPSQEPVK